MSQAKSLTYDYGVIRAFSVMTVVWGIVGMLVGVIIAAQMAWPALNFDIPWLSFGRLRPLHTNAVIFAFGGCALFATSYFVVQRTSQTTLFLPGLAWFTFFGWQLVILLAAADAVGCPNCKDGVNTSDPQGLNIARGYFYSILLMLAMPFTLAGSFAAYVWREMRRQKRLAEAPAPGAAVGRTVS